MCVCVYASLEAGVYPTRDNLSPDDRATVRWTFGDARHKLANNSWCTSSIGHNKTVLHRTDTARTFAPPPAKKIIIFQITSAVILFL